MSKLKLRTQTNCLNCGNEVHGRFCSHCSQENIEAHLSFSELASEAFKEIIDIDSNFYRTLKNIFTRPGYVPKQYSLGKRKSFSNPMRMFFIVGALFVLLLNYFIDVDAIVNALVQNDIDKNLQGKPLDFETEKAKIYPLYSFIFGNVSYAIILTLPLLCLLLKPITGGKKYYFTDLFVYKVCNYVAYLVIWTAPLILVFFFPSLAGIGLYLAAGSILTFYTYTMISTHNYFGYSWIKSFFMAWLQIILWLIVFALILFISFAVYYQIQYGEFF